MTEINEVNNREYMYGFGTKNKPQNLQRANHSDTQPDEFVKKDASKDGKFTFKEALKNFGKGLISPIKAMIQHPFITIATLAGMGAACAAVPVLAPILGVGFAGLSIFQLGKGIIKTTKEYKNGNFDDAEKGFENIGSGFLNTALSVFGLKSTARIAAESKFMNKNNLNVLTQAQKTEIAQSTQGGLLNAFKENLSLVTTKEGRSAVIAQFKPSAMKERFTSFFDFRKHKIEVKETQKIKMTPEEFAKTPEGIRRANLTQEQMTTEIQTKFDAVFDELGIPKEQRPKLEIKSGEAKHGGSYSRSKHLIEINPEAYKTGVFELDNVMMHEATHCRETLLRAGIPQDKLDKIIIEELSNRILHGENEQIIQGTSICGARMMTPPKMSVKAREEFLAFVKEYLYTHDAPPATEYFEKDIVFNLQKYNLNRSVLKSPTTNAAKKAELLKEIQDIELKMEPIFAKLRGIIDRNPDFKAQYENPQKAFDALCAYAESHGNRFRMFTNNKVGGKPYNGMPLTTEQLKLAEQSMRDYIATSEGNGRISGFNGIFATQNSFNQYQFSPEEVLAQQNGNNWLIKNLQIRLAELKSKPNYNIDEEKFITTLIDKAQKTIEFKTKGLEYYNLYNQMINNPNNQELVQTVAKLEQELSTLKNAVDEADMIEITKLVEKFVRKDYASAQIPLNITALLEEYRNKTL